MAAGESRPTDNAPRQNRVTGGMAIVCVPWRSGRSDHVELRWVAPVSLSHIDAQMLSARTAGEAPHLSEGAWPHLASEIRASVASLGEPGANRIRAALAQSPEDYATELSAFQGWIEFASSFPDNATVVRARVMTELYVSFVVLRDLLSTAGSAMPVGSPLAEVDRFLASGRREELRRAVASGRWGYRPDFTGLRIWRGGDGSESGDDWDVSQVDLHAWQTLSRGAAIAILAALTE